MMHFLSVSNRHPSDSSAPGGVVLRGHRFGRLFVAAPFVMAFLLTLLGGGMAYRSSQTRSELRAWVEHTHTVTQLFDAIERAVVTAETTQRGYLLTGDVAYLARGRTAPAAARSAIATATQLTGDSPVQRERIATIGDAVEQRLMLVSETLGRAVAGDAVGALAMIRSHRGEQLTQTIMRLIAEGRDHERRLLEIRMTREAEAARDVESSVALMGITALFSLVFGLLLVRREMHQTRHALAAVRTSEARFRAVFDHAPVGLTVLDAQGVVTTANDAFSALVARPTTALAGIASRELSPPDDAAASRVAVQQLIDGESEEVTVDTRYLRPDGELRLATLTLALLPDEHGGAARILGITQDITEARQLATTLREREAQMRGAIEASLDAVLIYRAVRGPAGALLDFEISQCNARAGELLSMPAEDLIGHHLAELFPITRESGLFALLERVVRTGVPATHDLETSDPRSVARWVRMQIVRVDDGLAVTARDITEERRDAEVLRAQAHVDELTGLYNRRGFLAAAEREWQRALREHRGVAMVCLDLDGFKQINDSYGHPEGDAALRTMADVLRAAFRGADVVGRLGGDEFVALVVPGGPAGAAVDAAVVARQVGERIRAHLAATNDAAAANGCAYQIRTSMGMATVSVLDGQCAAGEPQTVAALLQMADTRLYEEKGRRGPIVAVAA